MRALIEGCAHLSEWSGAISGLPARIHGCIRKRVRFHASRGFAQEANRKTPFGRLLPSSTFRQGIQDFGGCRATAMLLDDLTEEDHALPVDQERRRIGRFIRSF